MPVDAYEAAFKTAVEFVLDEEDASGKGVITNDAGGLTRWGISQRAYPNLDIRSLTREAAIEIYRKDYYDACKCFFLPATIGLVLFDSAVNQGPGRAVRLLQESLNVAVDGAIGPKTIAAVLAANPMQLVSELTARRLFAYGTDPNFHTDGLGWCRRASACHQLAIVIHAS